MATNKLTMLLELSDKMFNSKLGKLQDNWNKTVDKMKVKYQSVIDKLPGGLGKMVDKMKVPIAGLALGAATMFGTLATQGIDAAARFDEAFVPIRNLNLDKSKAELDSYRGLIRDAAFETGLNLVDSTKAVYDLQSATGLFGKDAVDIFKKVGVYSQATGANIQDAMGSTVKAMRAFGLGVKDIDALLISNAKTVQMGITTFDELSKVQTEYLGSAASSGQGVDTANKIFAAFTSISKNSDIGANMTKTFFDGLTQQSSKIKDKLKIDVFDGGKMKDATKILDEIGKKFEKMSDAQIAAVVNEIGGPEGLQVMLKKVQTGAEDLQNTFNGFDTSKFSLKDAMANAEGDVTKMREILGNRLEILLTKFGEKFYPLIAGIFDKLNPVLEWLYQNFDDVIAVVGTFTAVVGILTGAVWLFNMAMYANPVVWIIAAIGALIAIIVLAIKHYNEWGATLLWFLGPIGRVISAFKLIYDHWDSIKQAFKDEGIIGALKRIGVVLMDVILQPVQQILDLLAKLPGSFGRMAASARDEVYKFRHDMNLVKTPEEERLAKHTEMEKIYGSEAAYFLAQQKKQEEESKNFYGGDLSAKGKGGLMPTAETKTKNKLKDDVAKVSGAAKEVKNIKIEIGALHKGDNHINNGGGKGMTMADFEALYNELLMRIVRNAELS